MCIYLQNFCWCNIFALIWIVCLENLRNQLNLHIALFKCQVMRLSGQLHLLITNLCMPTRGYSFTPPLSLSLFLCCAAISLCWCPCIALGSASSWTVWTAFLGITTITICSSKYIQTNVSLECNLCLPRRWIALKKFSCWCRFGCCCFCCLCCCWPKSFWQLAILMWKKELWQQAVWTEKTLCLTVWLIACHARQMAHSCTVGSAARGT